MLSTVQRLAHRATNQSTTAAFLPSPRNDPPIMEDPVFQSLKRENESFEKKLQDARDENEAQGKELDSICNNSVLLTFTNKAQFIENEALRNDKTWLASIKESYRNSNARLTSFVMSLFRGFDKVSREKDDAVAGRENLKSSTKRRLSSGISSLQKTRRC